MYFDSVEDSGVALTGVIDDRIIDNLYLLGYSANTFSDMDLRDFLMTSDVMTQTDVDNFEDGNFDEIDNMLVFYPCDELAENMGDA